MDSEKFPALKSLRVFAAAAISVINKVSDALAIEPPPRTKEWVQGSKARRWEQLPRTANPYPKGTLRHGEWNDGWECAKAMESHW